jgi:hypothetical protein
MRLPSTSEARLDVALIAAPSDLRPSLLGSSTFIIENDLAVEYPRSTANRARSRGPPSGAAVVTAGAAELFGIDLRVEKNHYPRSKEVTIYALDY